MKFTFFDILFLCYFLGINLVYTLLINLGAIRIFLRKNKAKLEKKITDLDPLSIPGITFIIPIYNESQAVFTNIHNMLKFTSFPNQIIIINDGSTNDFPEKLKQEYDFISIPKFYEEELKTENIVGIYQSKAHKELFFIDKEHGGKFDAVNAGVNAMTHPFFVTLDADTFLVRSAFEELLPSIIASPKTIALGAGVRIINGCTIENEDIETEKFPDAYLPAMQSIEYLRAFLLRQGLQYFNAHFVISGSFCIFPKELFLQIGGFVPSQAEDMEVVFRLHRIMREVHLPYKITYIANPVAWTIAPETIKHLGRQRRKWHLGLLESLWYHKYTLFNTSYGSFGILGAPFGLIAEAIEPIFEISTFIYIFFCLFTQTLNYTFLVLILLSTLGYTALYTMFCLFLEEYSFRKYRKIKNIILLILSSLVENIGYRQMTLYWRFQAFILFFKRFKSIRKNGKMTNDLIVKTAKKMSH